MLSNWVTARRQPDRAAPRQAAGGPPRPHGRRGDAHERLRARRTRASQAGAGIVGQTIQYHGTADRYTLNGASQHRHARTRQPRRATANPAVTLRSVGSSGGQAAAFAYDLARSVVLTRQGNPAWVGQDRDGDFPIRPERPLLRRQRRRRPAGLAQHVQDRDPSGRRAAAPAREPDRDDGAGPEAVAALLVSPARREGRDRDDRRRPRASAAPPAASTSTGRQARRAARSRSGSASAAPRTSIPRARSRTPRPPRTSPKGSRSRCTSTPTGGLGCANWTPASLESMYFSQLNAFTAKYTSVPTVDHEPHSLRRVERLVDPARRPSSPTASASTRTTTTTPRAGSAACPAS